MMPLRTTDIYDIGPNLWYGLYNLKGRSLCPYAYDNLLPRWWLNFPNSNYRVINE